MLVGLLGGFTTASVILFATLLCFKTGVPLSGGSPGAKAERLVRATVVLLVPTVLVTSLIVFFANDALESLASKFVEKPTDRLPAATVAVAILVVGLITVLLSYVPPLRDTARQMLGGKTAEDWSTPVGGYGDVVQLKCSSTEYVGVVSAWMPDEGTVGLCPTLRSVDTTGEEYDLDSVDEVLVPMEGVESFRRWSVDDFLRRFRIRNLARPVASWEECLTAIHRSTNRVEKCRVDHGSPLEPTMLVEYSCTEAGRWTLRTQLRLRDGTTTDADLCEIEVPEYTVDHSDVAYGYAATVLRDDKSTRLARFERDFEAAASNPMELARELPGDIGRVLVSPLDVGARVRVFLRNIHTLV